MFHSGYGCPTVVTDVSQWLWMSHSGYWCSTVVMDVPQWLLMFHSGYGCPTVVTDVPLWLLMFNSGYWYSTWWWWHIGTPWPQTQYHLPETLSSLFKRWLDSVNTETEYTVLQVWTFWLWWVCQYFRYVGEILKCFVRAHHCYTHQYFAVRSLGTAADNCVTYTLFIFGKCKSLCCTFSWVRPVCFNWF